jgi:hypothetical protein
VLSRLEIGLLFCARILHRLSRWRSPAAWGVDGGISIGPGMMYFMGLVQSRDSFSAPFSLQVDLQGRIQIMHELCPTSLRSSVSAAPASMSAIRG